MAIGNKIVVSVSQPQFLSVVANPSTGALQNSNNPITLKNNPPPPSLEQLLDVKVVNKTDGAGVYYNAENHKYEIKQLEVQALNLDGGSF